MSVCRVLPNGHIPVEALVYLLEPFRLLVQSPDVVKQLKNLSSPMGMFHVGL